MNNYKFISHYAKDRHWRESLNAFSRSMWGITVLEEQDKDYVPFSMAHNNEVIANVCVGRFDLIVNQQPLQASMIQTVMTQEAHRNKGLIRQLFEPVQAHIAETTQLTFFTANKNKREFYGQFGYKTRSLTSHFVIEDAISTKSDVKLAKVDLNVEDQRKHFEAVASKRAPVSDQLGFVNRNWLMFWFIKYFHGDQLYQLPESETYAILEETDQELILKDIISERIPTWQTLRMYLPSTQNKSIHCRFTPDLLDVKATPVLDDEDDFFFDGFDNWPEFICLPETQRG